MRIRLIIKDAEYQQAMINTIEKSDKDIYVEIGKMDGCEDVGDKTLIITDYSEEECIFLDIPDFHMRVVFLTTDPKDVLDVDKAEDFNRLFKYNSMSSIFSDIEQIYYRWTGETNTSLGLVGRVYAVCSSKEGDSSIYAKALARQIVFRRGGSILLISLQYINNYACIDETNTSRFSRLMYYLDINQEFPAEAFTYSDAYGISYMRLPSGLNPVAYLDLNDMENMVRSFSHRYFDTVILDVGNSYSEVNVRMVNKVDNVLWLDSDSAKFSLNEIFIEKDLDNRTKRIIVRGKDVDVEPAIDDYVRNIYGVQESLANEEGNH